eukprot:1044131-Rhodomonas_salina.1
MDVPQTTAPFDTPAEEYRHVPHVPGYPGTWLWVSHNFQDAAAAYREGIPTRAALQDSNWRPQWESRRVSYAFGGKIQGWTGNTAYAQSPMDLCVSDMGQISTGIPA